MFFLHLVLKATPLLPFTHLCKQTNPCNIQINKHGQLEPEHSKKRIHRVLARTKHLPHSFQLQAKRSRPWARPLAINGNLCFRWLS